MLIAILVLGVIDVFMFCLLIRAVRLSKPDIPSKEPDYPDLSWTNQ